MAEVAGEELAKLEAAHPGRFGPLKAELERLVADPALDAAAFPSPVPVTTATDDDGGGGTAPASSQPAPSLDGLVCTQGSSSTSTSTEHSSSLAHSLMHHAWPCSNIFAESSTRRKRKPPGGGAAREPEEGRRRRRTGTPPGRAKDRAEMAIERAERCLERIRAVKRGLLAAWIH